MSRRNPIPTNRFKKTRKRNRKTRIRNRKTGQVDTKKEKTYNFAMAKQPWSQVFQFITDKTDLPFIGVNVPTGTFTFTPPKGREYTLGEIVDIINDALLTQAENQKWLFIRRERSFTVIPADQKLDPSLLRIVKIEELPTLGRTELVRVQKQVTGLNVEEVATTLQKAMSQFGQALALPDSNTLIMTDTAGSLEGVLDILAVIEKEGADAATYMHLCKYILARDAEKVLKDLLDPNANAPVNLDPRAGRGGGGGFGGGGFNNGGGGGFDPRQFDPRFGGAPGGGGPGGGRQQRAVKPTTITSNELQNTVYVSGPADKVSQARKIVESMDKGDKEIVIGGPKLVTYPVLVGTADTLVKMLSEKYQNTTVKISAAPGISAVLVMAPEGTHKEIGDFIKGTEGTKKAEIVSLTVLDATDIATRLQKIFGDQKAGAPYIEEMKDTNSIAIHGSEAQIKDVKAVIAALGESNSGSLRVLTLDQGSAAAVAEVMKGLLEGMGKKVEVIDPNKLVDPSKEKKPEKAPSPERGNERGDSRRIDEILKRGVLVAQVGNKPPLFDPAADEKKDEKKGPTIKLIPSGNKVIIVTDDPEAQKMIQQLYSAIINTKTGGDDYVVITLKNANAVDAARMLDEWFNGPRQQQQGNRGGFGAGFGGGFGGGFPGGGGGGGQTTRTDRIRVVADQNNNQLLVKASPIDVVMIKRLISNSIDNDNPDGKMKNFIIGPLKNTSATEVAQVLQQVYRESINTSSSGRAGTFAVAFGNPNAGQPRDANGNVKPVTLSICVDDINNSIVVQCTEKMHTEVKTLVDKMEEAAGKESPQTIKIVQIAGVDPLLLQQAIDILNGTRRASATTTPAGGNFGAQPGFGGGGGNRGGGFGGGAPGGGGYGGGAPGGGGFGGGGPGGGGFGGGGFGGGGLGGGGFGAQPAGGGGMGGGGNRGGGGGGGRPGGGGGGGGRPGGGGGLRPDDAPQWRAGFF